MGSYLNQEGREYPQGRPATDQSQGWQGQLWLGGFQDRALRPDSDQAKGDNKRQMAINVLLARPQILPQVGPLVESKVFPLDHDCQTKG